MKSFGYERIVAWIVLAALAAFTVACIFWTPYDQSKLLRPIPANAVMISSHRNLGSRLEIIATNIFFKSFFDFNETDLKNIRSNRYTARILSSHLIIMAYVPDFDQSTTRSHAKRLASAWSSNPALAVLSWVGGWSPVLRWALWIHPPKDIMPLGDYNGHRLWAYEKPVSFLGAANYFSFAIDEGMFIGCLSQDRNGVIYLLRNSDGRKDSILNVPACPSTDGRSASGRPQCRLLASSTAADQIWMRFNLPYSPQKQSVFATCSLDAIENDYLAATIRFEPDIHLDNYIGQNRDLLDIGKIYACSPSIAALFPSDMVADGLNGLTRPGGLISPAWARAVKPIFAPSSGANNVCLLTVFTGDYGGHYGPEPFRVSVPTVLLAVSGARQEQTKAAVLELLDLINLKHRLGLILNSALPSAGQCPIFAIESTSSAPLNSLPVEDRPAFAFYNDWFLLASNSAGLRKILLNFQSQAVAPDDGNNIWLKRADNRQTKAFIWIDPGEGGKALRFALTASIIMLDADGLPAMPTRIALQAGRDPSKQNTIKILKGLRAWLETISNLENCAAWIESENGKMVVRLEIGCKN